jgi:membrane associated rhomboid family serine protease
MYDNAYRPPTQFSVFPPVIKNLLIINGLVYFAQMVPTTANLLVYWFALWPMGTVSAAPDFWPWQLVSYGFLHGGLGHIFFNMFALWMFGAQLENAWGSKRFAIFYFVCVIGAGLIQLLVMWGVPVPTVGASGGVYGVLLAFGMMFPNQPIYVYFLFPIKAKWFVLIFGGIALWAGVTGTQAGIAHFAHLGGMFFGFLVIQYWRGKLPKKPAHRMYW